MISSLISNTQVFLPISLSPPSAIIFKAGVLEAELVDTLITGLDSDFFRVTGDLVIFNFWYVINELCDLFS